MKFRGERDQKAIAGMMTGGFGLVSFGVYISLNTGPYHRSAGFFMGVGLAIALVGVALVGLGIVAGVSTALFGVLGQTVFAKRTMEQVTVEARFLDDGQGGQDFDADPPPEVPGKRYLRLAMSDQTFVEVRCDPVTYTMCEEGSVGLADIRGERLYSFRKLGP